ncbi:serine hydrolase domain-containing protein [soil metagenome]
MTSPLVTSSPLQNTMQSLLNQLVADGRERGAQVAVYHRGKLVADVWAGVADPATGREVNGETLFPVFSVSKGMAATVIHRLVDRGLLSYDRPIAEIWPEFGVNGKEKITLRQALNHTSGIFQMPEEAELETTCDWEKMCQLVAQLMPVFPPGTKAQYHAITFGWIIGEPACRVTGLSFPELLQREVTDPLGLGDSLYIGIPRDRHPDVAVLEHQIDPPVAKPGPQSVTAKLGTLHEMMNRRELQEACIPATSGVMSARAVARHYAALLPGGVDGIALLSPARVREITTVRESEPAEINHVLGYGLHGERAAVGRPALAFGHGGHGGSVGFTDMANHYAVGYTRNRFDDGECPGLILEEIKKALS